MTETIPGLFDSLYKGLNEGQSRAMESLNGPDNVFVTGGAGTGKSYLIKQFYKAVEKDSFPILASTGAAAVLVGGRTFHSFFGLGIMEGGIDATFERALKDKRVVRRLKKAKGIVIDEISMIPGEALSLAECIASEARDSEAPWGGLKVIAVGDFAQLPPISRGSQKKDWAFTHPVWERSGFVNESLEEIMRSADDQDYCDLLGQVRNGEWSEGLADLLSFRTVESIDDLEDATVLFARRDLVDRVNEERLSKLEGNLYRFETTYTGSSQHQRALRKTAPIPETILLKDGAFVMLRQNDPQGRWVNGSLGHVSGFDEDDAVIIRLLSGREVEIVPSSFTMLDADGKEVASAKNFPLSLAWAITIHKAQGATLDKAAVSLERLWEPGQAYVAMSRVRKSSDLFVLGWDQKSIFADPVVKKFHLGLNS